MTYLLLAREEKEIELLKQGLHFSLFDLPKKTNGALDGVTIKDVLVHKRSADSRRWFHDLSPIFDDALNKGDLTILVSGVRPYCLNPLVDTGWESVLAMLILSFPEARWLFGTIYGYLPVSGNDNEEARKKRKDVKTELDAFRTAHGIGNLFAPTPSFLFDSYGLRDWIRRRAIADKSSAIDAKYLACRELFAVALDEETAYSHLHAYAAYRFGFRAAAVTSSRVADRILGEGESGKDLCLVFEDIYINFADGRSGMSWLDASPDSKKESRRKAWPRLERVEHRIFVTSGQRIRGDELKWECNEAYIARQKTVQRITTLHKPYAGIFRIWQDSKLARRLKWTDDKGKTRRGTAKSFVWPPRRESFEDNEHGHSSPGVLLVIAEKLIERAGKLTDLNTIADAIRGAVLATDALEILGCRTPTVAIEALRLKHYFEVLAECQFSGVEHHIHLHDRLKEIRRDVRAISYWFATKKRTSAELNAEMMILLSLVRLLQKQAQFDEEQYLMNRVRCLHNTIWMREGVGAFRWRYIFWPFLRYSEFLLTSFSRFSISIALWVAALTASFWFFRAHQYNLPDGKQLGAGWEAFSRAFSAFTGSDPLTVTGVALPVLTVFAVLAGLAHLGIFVSHLYTLVTRK